MGRLFYFYKKEIENLILQIESVEIEINKIIYKMYEMSDEKITIVENFIFT